MISILSAVLGISLIILIHLYTGNKDIYSSVIYSICYYFILFFIIGDLTLFVGCFSLNLCSGLSIIISLCISLIVFYKHYKAKKTIETDISFAELKNNAPFIILSILLIICLNGHFGFYGMGQDEGVYQTEAINLSNGINTWKQYIEEWNGIEDASYKSLYEENVQSLQGFDCKSSQIEEVGVNYDYNSLYGYWHGTPSFSILLSYSINMFGIENMMLLQYIIYFCLVNLFIIFINKRDYSKISKVLFICLFGLCPEVMWVTKSALTETFMAVMVVLFIIDVLDNRITSIIPVIGINMYHLTCLTLLPLFLFIYSYKYLEKKRNVYIFLSFISGIVYLLSYFLFVSLNPRYTIMNYNRGIVKQKVPVEYMYLVPIVITAISILYNIIIIFLRSKIKLDYIKKFVFVFSKIIFSALMMKILVGVLIHRNINYSNFVLLSYVCFAFMTGLFMFIVLNAKLLSGKYDSNNNTVMMLVIYGWGIGIFSLLVRYTTNSYYYYARYLMPYIAIIFIAYVMLVKYKKVFTEIVLTLSLMFIIPYSLFVSSMEDDTKIDLKSLNNILTACKSSVEENVLLDDNYLDILYFPLKAMGKNVYIIDESVENTEKILGLDNYLVVTNNYLDEYSDYLLHIEDTYWEEESRTKISTINGMPLETVRYDYNIYIYDYIGVSDRIMATDELFLDGWGNPDSQGNRWMLGDEAHIGCYLNQEETYACITFGGKIPLNELNRDNIAFEIYVNGYKCSTQVVTEDNNSKFIFEIPIDIQEKGYNDLEIRTDECWSPYDLGSNDESLYGISVNCIDFISAYSKQSSIESDDCNWSYGWTDNSIDNTRWMNSQNASIMCVVPSGIKSIVLELGYGIPFNNISNKEFELELYINGEYIDEVFINDNSKEIAFQINDLSVLERNGIDEIVLKADKVWSPSEYGSGDTSNYVINISRIRFE